MLTIHRPDLFSKLRLRRAILFGLTLLNSVLIYSQEDSTAYSPINSVAALLQGEHWVLISEINFINDSSVDRSSAKLQCEEDDFIEFNNDGNYHKYQGEQKCEGQESEILGTGTWRLANPDIIVDRFQGGRPTRKYIEISEDQLVMRYSAQGGITKELTYLTKEAVETGVMRGSEPERSIRTSLQRGQAETLAFGVATFEINAPEHRRDTFVGSYMIYPDPYQSLYFQIGSRGMRTEEYAATLTIEDQSAFSSVYRMNTDIEAQNRRPTFELGYERGDYTNYHFEISAAWSFGDIRSSSIGAGIGYNRSLGGGREVLRTAASLHYTTYSLQVGQMDPNGIGGQTNITIDGTDFYEIVQVSLRRRAIELRPKIELISRIHNGFQLKGCAGVNLPLVVNRGFVKYTGSDSEGIEREKTKESHIDLSIDGEPTTSRYLPYTGIGLFWGIGVSYNLSHPRYSAF